MIAYLAAPYSHDDESVVTERMRQFYLVDARLMEQGTFTVSPLQKHAILKYRDLPGSWEYWKEYSQTLLKLCDKMIVITLPGWEQSVGLKAEIELAESWNIPIEYITFQMTSVDVFVK